MVSISCTFLPSETIINMFSRGGRRGVVRERAGAENMVMTMREGKAMAEKRGGVRGEVEG